MKHIKKHFGLTAVALIFTLLMSSFIPEVNAPIDGAQAENYKINSRFGGVQIGVITYSFRSIREVDVVIQACVDAGHSSVELMGTGIEAYLGASQYCKIRLEFPNQVKAIHYLSTYGESDHQMGYDWHW
jgi:hypothetical protein